MTALDCREQSAALPARTPAETYSLLAVPPCSTQPSSRGQLGCPRATTAMPIDCYKAQQTEAQQQALTVSMRVPGSPVPSAGPAMRILTSTRQPSSYGTPAVVVAAAAAGVTPQNNNSSRSRTAHPTLRHRLLSSLHIQQCLVNRARKAAAAAAAAVHTPQAGPPPAASCPIATPPAHLSARRSPAGP